MRQTFSRLILLLALACALPLGAEIRSWTFQASGKSFEAEFVDVEEDCVTLRVRGRERHVRLSRLSAEDRAYVLSRTPEEKEHFRNENFSDRWPGTTIMEDKLRAKAVVEDEESGIYIYETAHFRFYSPARLNLPTVSEMGRVFEGTYTACRAIPLNFPCRRFDSTLAEEDSPAPPGEEELPDKLVARLFLTQADYIREVGTAYASSTGIFREPEILVPFESLGLKKKGRSYAMDSADRLDTGTLIHELTHQMSLIGATYDVPIWFAEGMAEYVRLANYKRGRFNFDGVHKNIITYFVGGPGTTSRQLGRHITAPPLEQLMNQSVREFQSARGDDTQFNYGFSALLVYYFIHLDGKGDAAALKRWMRHLQGTKRATSSLSVTLPADASPQEIAAAQERLRQQAMSLREDYHYSPLLQGRSWQELEEEFSRKVEKELGIHVRFGTHTP